MTTTSSTSILHLQDECWRDSCCRAFVLYSCWRNAKENVIGNIPCLFYLHKSAFSFGVAQAVPPRITVTVLPTTFTSSKSIGNSSEDKSHTESLLNKKDKTLCIKPFGLTARVYPDRLFCILAGQSLNWPKGVGLWSETVRVTWLRRMQCLVVGGSAHHLVMAHAMSSSKHRSVRVNHELRFWSDPPRSDRQLVRVFLFDSMFIPWVWGWGID